jgi:hypothetical protein
MAGKGYYSYTSNIPRVQVDKAMSLLDGAELLIRYPDDVNLTEVDRRTANNNERFAYGCFNINDNRLISSGQPTLRRQMDWFFSMGASRVNSQLDPGLVHVLIDGRLTLLYTELA